MTRILFGLGAVGVALIFAACGEEQSTRSAARLVEVETTIQNGGNTAIERSEIHYAAGGRLKEVIHFHNGSPNGRTDYHYVGDLLDGVEFVDAEGDRATLAFDYHGKRVAATLYTVPGVSTGLALMEYSGDNARPDRITTTWTYAPNNAVSVEYLDYEYGDDRALARITALANGDTRITELRYDDAARLDRISSYKDGAHVASWDIDYRDGRVDEVSDSLQQRTTTAYDDEGRLVEIRRINANQTVTVRYTYEEGRVMGVTFAPHLPHGTRFDLRGRSFADVALLHDTVQANGNL